MPSASLEWSLDNLLVEEKGQARMLRKQNRYHFIDPAMAWAMAAWLADNQLGEDGLSVYGDLSRKVIM